MGGVGGRDGDVDGDEEEERLAEEEVEEGE